QGRDDESTGRRARRARGAGRGRVFRGADAAAAGREEAAQPGRLDLALRPLPWPERQQHRAADPGARRAARRLARAGARGLPQGRAQELGDGRHVGAARRQRREGAGRPLRAPAGAAGGVRAGARRRKAMSEAPLHPQYLHFSELPLSQRAVYTAALLILGMGYLFALIYLFHTYSGKDGNPLTLSYEDIVIAYSGTGKDSRLESALRGAMSAMLPRDEAAPII